MTKKTLSSLGVEEGTIANMKASIKKINEKNMFPITESDYRRYALELTNQTILSEDKIPKLNREVK